MLSYITYMDPMGYNIWNMVNSRAFFSLKHQPPVPAAATKKKTASEARLASTTWCRGCQRLGALGDLILMGNHSF